MKALAISLILLMALTPAIAEDKNENNSSAESACATPGHAHQYSDIRIAAIQVTDVDNCGISYADLESNTVGLDNKFQFTPDFEVIELTKNTSTGGDEVVSVDRKRKLKPGMRAVAVYCLACKAVFNMKPISNEGVARTLP